MDIQAWLHRLSIRQLRALSLLAQTSTGMADSVVLGKQIGVNGKSLGGLFSSISRQNYKGQKLIIAWGRTAAGRGLRWRLNEAVISKSQLLSITQEVLKYE